MTTHTLAHPGRGLPRSTLAARLAAFGKALVAELAASGRRRAMAELSDHQIAKLGIDRRALAYYTRHGRLPRD